MTVISFFSAKGGTGKTTFNILLASYLKYELGKRVLVLDFDLPEYNLSFNRKRDILYLKEQGFPYNKEQFYPIEEVEDLSEANLKAVAIMLKKMESDFDYILLDFPGSFTEDDAICRLSPISVIDKVVIPVELDPMNIASMKTLAKIFQEEGQETLLFFNRVHGKEKKSQYDAIREWFREEGIHISNHQVKMSIAMKREEGNGIFLRSTTRFPLKEIRERNPDIIGLFNEVIGYVVEKDGEKAKGT